MSQKYELIHSASSTSSLFIYRRVFVPLCSSKMPSVLLGAKRIPCSSTAGRVEPQLNGLEEAFDLDSNRSNTPVNQAKILLQHQELPPLNPTTNKKIDHQKIPIGFGEGARRAEGVQVAFELDSFRLCAAVNPRFPQAIHSSHRLKECLTSSAVQTIPHVIQSPKKISVSSGPVGLPFASPFISGYIVHVEYPRSIGVFALMFIISSSTLPC